MPYYNSNYSDAGKQSRFHQGFQIVDRLDKLWQQCNNLSTTGNLMSWNWKLDAVWRELSGDADDKDWKEFRRHNKLVGKNMNNKGNLYNILNRKEMFLRRLQNKQGKGIAYRDPDEDDMEI